MVPMQFHLSHIIPHPSMHGLNGYKDVIDSIQWGLEQLGHQTSYGVNQMVAGVRNIVFGVHMISEDEQAGLPADTIVYNMEQLRGVGPARIRSELRAAARRFQIWDYSEANLEAWGGIERAHRTLYVPVGHSRNLERIGKAQSQDIDVLIYGMPNEKRLSAFHALSKAGLTGVFVYGLYGAARDALIARSKTVLNITLYGDMRVFEIVRVSYLLANRKAVVANIDADTAIERGVLEAIAPTTPQTLRQIVAELCRDDAKRAELEQRGYDFFSKRDIRPILRRALDETD